MLTFHVHVSADTGQQLPPFDSVLDQYARLPRMFIELDGSFVWRGETDGQTWQVDGNLIDQGIALAYVELIGTCSMPQLDELLRPLGWPGVKLTYTLPRRGISVSESDFLSSAGSSNGAV